MIVVMIVVEMFVGVADCSDSAVVTVGLDFDTHIAVVAAVAIASLEFAVCSVDPTLFGGDHHCCERHHCGSS